MVINLELTSQTAILLSLTAGFMWGTWMISVKFLGEYPIDGFFITLFTTSLIFVWLVSFSFGGREVINNINEVYAADPSRIWVTLICGMLYVVGIRITLYVYKVIGLSLAMPIQSSMNILAGTMVSGLVGGIPEGLSLPLLILACISLVAAVIVSVISGRLRTRAQAANLIESDLRFRETDILRSVGLIFISSLFIPAYTFGISYGLQSISQPGGMAVLPFMALLATGAFIGSIIGSGLLLTFSKQWGKVISAGFYIHKFGIISGLFHYGGNIIHTYATAYLSSVVSWPLGVTSGLWTQLWGLAYGEFRGAPRSSLFALFSGITLYLIGAALIAYSVNGG
jgi:glucose uptake protein GlcU